MGQRGLEEGLAFVEALDDAQLDERTARLERLVAPDSTWWIDTGLDRIAGQRGYDAGDARPWPLHGTMPMHEKLELVSQIGPEIFPKGLGTRTVHGYFGDGDVAIVEVQGDGMHAGGKAYRNRYGFVIDVGDAGILSVREYLDTMHAEDVFGAERASRPSIAPPPGPRNAIEAASAAERVVLALMSALSAGDVDGIGALFASDATWWIDSGTDRERGAFGSSSGDAGVSPLHGEISIAEKLDEMRSGRGEWCLELPMDVAPVRIVSQDNLVGLEAESYAALTNGRIYQNRYLFIAYVGWTGIRSLRQYCDTLHLVDMLSATH